MPKQNEIILRSADTIRHFVADWNNRIPGSIATYGEVLALCDRCYLNVEAGAYPGHREPTEPTT